MDYSLLKDYTLWEEANPDNWNILSYANFHYNLDACLAFYGFFNPELILKECCIIISFLYNKSSYQSWKKEFNDNLQSIEKMCNLYAVKDFFHINEVDHFSKKVDMLAPVLQKQWQLHVDSIYPGKYVVSLFDSFGDTMITLYRRQSNCQ